jgi:hypothetical protein
MKKFLFLLIVLLAGTLALSASPARPPGAPDPEAAVPGPVLFTEPVGILSAGLVFIVPAGEPSVSFMICTSLYEDSGPDLIGAPLALVDYPLLC